MPPIEEQDRHQLAVLWMANGTDDYGQPKVDPAVGIDVRWDETQDEGTDANGNDVTILANVVVDRRIVPGSVMWKGDLAELPASPTGLMRVASYSEIPDVKGRNFRRSVKLMRHGDSLPTINS